MNSLMQLDESIYIPPGKCQNFSKMPPPAHVGGGGRVWERRQRYFRVGYHGVWVIFNSLLQNFQNFCCETQGG